MHAETISKLFLEWNIKLIRRHLPAALAVIIFCMSQCPAAGTQDGKVLIPDKAYLPNITVKDLNVEVYPENNIIRVLGTFANVSPTVIKGFITIYLLDGQGNVIYSVEMPANNHKAISSGQTVKFDEVFSVNSIKNAAVVSVDFTRE